MDSTQCSGCMSDSVIAGMAAVKVITQFSGSVLSQCNVVSFDYFFLNCLRAF